MLGIGAGLGYLASRVLIPRTTPMERIMDTIADEVRGSFGGLIPEAATMPPVQECSRRQWWA
jgi:hypothetical protein